MQEQSHLIVDCDVPLKRYLTNSGRVDLRYVYNQTEIVLNVL